MSEFLRDYLTVIWFGVGALVLGSLLLGIAVDHPAVQADSGQADRLRERRRPGRHGLVAEPDPVLRVRPALRHLRRRGRVHLPVGRLDRALRRVRTGRHDRLHRAPARRPARTRGSEGSCGGSSRPGPDARRHHQAAQHRSLVLDVGVPVGSRLLRHRDGRGVRLAALRRHAPRCDPAAGQPPPGRLRGDLGHGHRQDGAVDPAALRADARAQVRDLDGQLRQLRRPVLGQLLGHQGRRPDHPGRHLRAGVPAASRGAARGHRDAPAEDQTRGHGRQVARRGQRGHAVKAFPDEARSLAPDAGGPIVVGGGVIE